MEQADPENVGMYYTPKDLLKRIADPSAGSGSFLKNAANDLWNGLTQNPPYGKTIYLSQIKDAGGMIISQQICYSVSECAKFFEERGIRFYGKHSLVVFSQNVYTYQEN